MLCMREKLIFFLPAVSLSSSQSVAIIRRASVGSVAAATATLAYAKSVILLAAHSAMNNVVAAF